MISKGFFVIADITGYTEFLTQSGLEEAQSVLDHLFNGFLEAIKEPLIISNFQGDAVLAYAPEGSFNHGQILFEILENMYFAFAALVEQMSRSAACSCTACDNLPKLDLKLIIHYGAYAIQKFRDREELAGSDVVLAHRMLKNHVREKTGLKSYALLSEQALQQLGLDAESYGMLEVVEEYEHLGSVRIFVHDLRTQYESRKAQIRVFVKPEEAVIFLEKLLPSVPQVTWEYLTLPEHLKQWMTVEEIYNVNHAPGKIERGTVFQCVKKTDRIDYVITDWRPFSYLTVESTLNSIPYQATFSLMQTGNESLMRFYYRPMQNLSKEMLDAISTMFMSDFEKLEALVKLKTRTISLS